ncbi:endoglucanase [Ruminiclostridium herbifermentans]|uniref:Glucanase n=1 Tax=Ruminiclostridium herbifermentans TaxID=2488810 RepID=A0A4V6EN11_9FIRM|nr:glycosyl hydrolase family 8 [Ruminiclostridium herbifermentans]QNU68702.1 endoglucanase [Ruminiclostridium herbifermentans]
MMSSMKFKSAKTFVMTVVLLISLILPTILVNAADAAPFPYNAKYPYGAFSSLADDQSSANQLVKAEWESWKSAHITSNGARGFKRVQRDAATNYDTVSEGLGYGMLLAVYFGEQQLFNDLYGYVKCYFNSNGLMSWHIDANGNIIGNDGIGAATDADEDIAVALVFAHKKWGSNGSVNYESEAKSYISKIYNHMVERGTYIIKNGDTWGGTSCVNPSYFAPAWYRIYADFTGNSEWLKVADKCYEIIDRAKNPNTGLVPDWCTAAGGPANGMGYDFLYDAIRYQWRTAIDYSWYGTAKAKTNCDQISNFFKKIGITNIKDGYTITGNQINSNHTATFVSCGAAAAMTGTDSEYAKSAYNENVKVKDQGSYVYFGNSLRMLVLLYTTGNFPNLYNYKVEIPTFTKGDVNKDGSVDALDFAALKKALLSQSFNEIDTKAADMNEDGNIDAVDFANLKIFLLSK